MAIRVGTLVTQYDPYRKVRSCENGACVGAVQEIVPFSPNPNNPHITVLWYVSCGWHQNGSFTTMRLLSDELWEIGQTT